VFFLYAVHLQRIQLHPAAYFYKTAPISFIPQAAWMKLAEVPGNIHASPGVWPQPPGSALPFKSAY